jgi:hypothetical protein
MIVYVSIPHLEVNVMYKCLPMQEYECHALSLPEFYATMDAKACLCMHVLQLYAETSK